VAILPLRCYLDTNFILFLQDLSKIYSNLSENRKLGSSIDRGLNVENTNKAILPYFQHVLIASIHLKIDYEPGNYDI
jgi:hypothetical protein